VRVAHPFAINADATRFIGRFARWQVTTLTGRVLASKTTTTVHGSAPTSTPVYLDGSRVGQVNSGGYVTTTTHDTFRLLDPAGQQHSVSVKDFYADVNPGDVVTAAWASKGRQNRALVVANHTTRRLYANDVTIHEITSPHHIRLFGSVALAAFSQGSERRSGARRLNTQLQPMTALATQTRTRCCLGRARSAHLLHIKGNDDAVADRVCALVSLDGSVGLLRGKLGSHDIARYRLDCHGVVYGSTESADEAGIRGFCVLAAKFPGLGVVVVADGSEVRSYRVRWVSGLPC